MLRIFKCYSGNFQCDNICIKWRLHFIKDRCNFLTGISAEAQLPNLLPESYRTDIAVFLDSGNVWGVDYSDTLDDTNTIRSAFGISANTFTTIGPLSFTLAQDLSSASTDEPQKFNFRLFRRKFPMR